MFDDDTINFIDLHLLNGQVDLILSALQLYAFNLHNTWGVDTSSNKEDLRNALLFHTYEQILSKYNYEKKISYDVIGSCRLYSYRKRQRVYKLKKNIA